MKSAPTLRRLTLAWWVRLPLCDIGSRTISSLILNDFDVSGGRFEVDVAFGCPGQLLELTLVPTSSEGAAPRCRKIALAHAWSLGAGLTSSADFFSLCDSSVTTATEPPDHGSSDDQAP
jgi:hypothetical protein